MSIELVWADKPLQEAANHLRDNHVIVYFSNRATLDVAMSKAHTAFNERIQMLTHLIFANIVDGFAVPGMNVKVTITLIDLIIAVTHITLPLFSVYVCGATNWDRTSDA